MGKNRVHFIKSENLEVDETGEYCDVCGSTLYDFYETCDLINIKILKVMIRYKLGRYCLSDDCDVDDMEKEMFEDYYDVGD